VLVKVKTTPDAKEGHAEEEAKKLAQAALAEVKGGADFAAVARKASEDQGSAPQGGDLGCFPRGRMVTDFENAAFGLDAGQTSDLVRSPYGYHVIRVTSRKEETTSPFAQVKERVHQTLVGQGVRALMEEKVAATTDALRRGRSLEDTAKAQGLTVATSPPFSRADPPPALSSPALASRAFEMKRAETEGDPFPVSGGYAFISLAEVQPSRPPELKEVQDKVRADLKRARALEKAKATAIDLQARAEKDGLEKAAASLSLLRKETPGLVGRGQPMGDLGTSAALDREAYALPEKVLSDPIPVSGGLAVLRVLEKKPFDPAAFEKEKPQLLTSLREERKQELFRAYMEEARRRFPIQRHVEAYRRVMNS
jgi:peptidyl-prolyl cis-trans isomerase D